MIRVIPMDQSLSFHCDHCRKNIYEGIIHIYFKMLIESCEFPLLHMYKKMDKQYCSSMMHLIRGRELGLRNALTRNTIHDIMNLDDRINLI